ncbi:hypothetical protein NMY22_g9584 [Coprinellus aureogranulatus]|nr:hypothetical protein NMY22_g9584 [Coprinellus aureogranulatus]
MDEHFDFRACTNPGCKFKGSCNLFCPASPNQPGTPRAGQKCICECYGAQHAIVERSSDAPQVKKKDRKKKEPAAHTDSEPEVKAKAEPPLKSYTDAAKRAKERMDMGGRHGERMAKAFDGPHCNFGNSAGRSGKTGGTTKKANARLGTPEDAIDVDAEDSDAPPAKKEKPANNKPKPTSSSTAKAPKPKPGNTNGTKVHATRAIDSEKGMEKPNVTIMRRYQQEGYIKSVRFNVDMSVATIDKTILEAFSDTPFMQEGSGTLSQWRVALDMPQGKGKTARLQPLKRKKGGCSYPIVPWADECGNISIPDLDESASETDGGSDEAFASDEKDESDSTGKKHTETEKPAKGDSRIFGSNDSDSDSDDEAISDSLKECLNDSSITYAYRLTVNIPTSHTSLRSRSGSKVEAPWWLPSVLTYPYTKPVHATSGLVLMCDNMRQNPERSAFLTRLAPALDKYLGQLDFITSLAAWAGETRTMMDDAEGKAAKKQFNDSFHNEFRLGPYGLKPIIDALNVVDCLVRDKGIKHLSLVDCNNLIDKVDIMGDALVTLVNYFLWYVPRASFEPQVFSTLRNVIDLSKASYFLFAGVDESLSVLSLDLETASVSDYREALLKDFGGMNDAQTMDENKIKMGVYGVHGFLDDVIAALLDVMPIDHPNYQPLYDLFEKFAVALTQKIVNFEKSAKKRKEREAAQANPSSPKRPRTRSTASEHTPASPDVGAEEGDVPKYPPPPPPPRGYDYVEIDSDDPELKDEEMTDKDSDDEERRKEKEDFFDSYKGATSPPNHTDDEIPVPGEDPDPKTFPKTKFFYEAHQKFKKEGTKTPYPEFNPNHATESANGDLGGEEFRTVPFNFDIATPEQVIHELEKYCPKRKEKWAKQPTELYAAILRLVPHPDPSAPQSLSDLGYQDEHGRSTRDSRTKGWRKLCRTYHPDKNLAGNAPGTPPGQKYPDAAINDGVIALILVVVRIFRTALVEHDTPKKNRFVGAVQTGTSVPQAAKLYGIGRSTGYEIWNKFQETGSTSNRPRSGRPRKVTSRNERHIINEIKANRRKPFKVIARENPADISDRIVRKVAASHGYHRCVAKKKPYHTKLQKTKRYIWAKDHEDWTNNEWKNVIWSDECYVHLDDTSGRIWVTRKADEKYDENCMVPTFKQSSVRAMVWGCMMQGKKGPLVALEYPGGKGGGMNSQRPGVVFQQDNAGGHTAKKTKKWLADHGIKVFPHPPASPDVSPIEPAWDDLKDVIRESPRHPTSVPQLIAAIKAAWDSMDISQLDKHSLSMMDRVAAVLEAKGGATKF